MTETLLKEIFTRNNITSTTYNASADVWGPELLPPLWTSAWRFDGLTFFQIFGFFRWGGGVGWGPGLLSPSGQAHGGLTGLHFGLYDGQPVYGVCGHVGLK